MAPPYVFDNLTGTWKCDRSGVGYDDAFCIALGGIPPPLEMDSALPAPEAMVRGFPQTPSGIGLPAQVCRLH